MGGLHSGETGPSEMLMELRYRLATETSPLIKQIRDNVIVSITPVADPDGRDRNVDWFYKGLDEQSAQRRCRRCGRGAVRGAPGAARCAGAGGGRGGAALPYWGKYVFHDNNRDINLSQVSMRAIVDWYFTAHPPIMHDLHEAQPLLYTYSGGPPQNPNLDPILFAELPFFSNFELAQMTKSGMPGVYTHAFMDGWSPGYLGSVAYNHNGMMRMYETQSGRESGPGPARSAVRAARRCRRGATALAPAAPRGARAARRAAGCRDALQRRRPAAPTPAAAADARRGGAWRADVAAAADAARRRCGRGAGGAAAAAQAAPAAPGGGAVAADARPAPDGTRRRTAARVVSRAADSAGRDRQLLAAQQHELHGDRRALRPAADVDVPEPGDRELLHEDAELDRRRQDRRAVRLRHPGGHEGHDARRRRSSTSCARSASRSAQANAEIKIGGQTFPAGSYVIKRDQPYGRLAKNLLEKQNYPDPNLTTYDDSGWTMGLAMRVEVKEIKDKAILDVGGDAGEGRDGQGQGHRQRARPAWRSRTTARTT